MLNNINMVLDYILAINGFDSQYVYFPLSKTKIIEEIIWKISLPEFSSHFPQTKTYTNCKLEPVNKDGRDPKVKADKNKDPDDK